MAADTGTDEQEVEESQLDAKSFYAGLEDVVEKIKNLATVYNNLDEEQQDVELARIKEKFPYVQEMIVMLLRKWPLL